VLREAVRGHVKLFGEQVRSLNEKVERLAGDVGQRLSDLEGEMDLPTRTILSKIDAHERTHAS
jgi:hypothetical protein